MNWEVEYFKKEDGKIPVVEFLLALPLKIRAKVFSEIELLKKHGDKLKEPYVKPIKGKKYKGIYELRVKFSSNINRIFFFTYSNNTFVLLNGLKNQIKFLLMN